MSLHNLFINAFLFSLMVIWCGIIGIVIAMLIEPGLIRWIAIVAFGSIGGLGVWALSELGKK